MELVVRRPSQKSGARILLVGLLCTLALVNSWTLRSLPKIGDVAVFCILAKKPLTDEVGKLFVLFLHPSETIIGPVTGHFIQDPG